MGSRRAGTRGRGYGIGRQFAARTLQRVNRTLSPQPASSLANTAGLPADGRSLCGNHPSAEDTASVTVSALSPSRNRINALDMLADHHHHWRCLRRDNTRIAVARLRHSADFHRAGRTGHSRQGRPCRLRDGGLDFDCRPALPWKSWIILAAVGGIAVGYIVKRRTSPGDSA